MVKTASIKLPLGLLAPLFSLPDIVSDRIVSLSDFQDKQGLLVMFICNSCPFVQHVKHELSRIGHDYLKRGLGIVAITTNDTVASPQDRPEALRLLAAEQTFCFPLCFDRNQEVTKAFQAACTPDFFLFNAAKRLVYHGQLDDSRPDNHLPVDGRDLRAAIDAVLKRNPVPANQKPSVGSSILWQPGNEPDYL